MVAGSIAFIPGVFFGVLLVILFAPMPHLSKSHNSPSTQLNKEEKRMKIYHTETQEDFDALLGKLKNEGYSWFFGEAITSYNSQLWERNKQNTVVHIEEEGVSCGSLSYAKYLHPNIPIEKYKVKQDEVAKWFYNTANAMKAFASNGVSMKKRKY